MTSADGRSPCPYVGLQPFQEQDREFFFGRERDQRLIISNLLASPLTILYGSSGVGKSSVLMAGVVPQLHRDRPKTPVVVFRSWVGDFRMALSRACINEVWKNDVGQPKPAETLPFDEVLRACGEAAHETILVLFDQFEEYFLYHPKSADPQSFEAQFARAINRDDVDIGFLIALREDSLSKLDRFQERVPNLLSNRLRLNHLDEAGAAAAIRSPLEVWNCKYSVDQPPVTIEDALIGALLEQVRIGRVSVGRHGGSGAVAAEQRFIEAPFLQLVMTRLWAEEMAAGSRSLRLATLDRLKGAKEIVRTHLDNVMAGLDATSQAVCASFFDRLVTPSGSKVACSKENLAYWAGRLAPQVAAVLETLSNPDNRILRTVAASPDQPEATSYEIYHDVLAPAIVGWRQRYVEKQERAVAVEQARTQARERARRQWVVALLGMTAFAFLGWGVATWQRWRAEANQKAAESIATSPYDAKRGLDLALEAAEQATRFGLSPTTAAEDALRQAIQASPLEWSFPVDGWVSDVTFSPDGRMLAIGGRDKSAQVWDLGSGERPREATHSFSHSSWVRGIAFLPSGERLATAAGDTVRVWKANDAKAEPVAFKHGSDMYSAFAVSRDGTRVATAGNGDRVIKVWDLETGSPEPLLTIDMAGAWVMGLAFSPDGSCVATANVERGSSWRSSTEIWSIKTGAKILRVPTSEPSDAVAFTPDGKALVTASRDDRVRVWRPAVAELDRVLATRSEWLADAEATPLDPAAACPAGPPDILWSVRVLAGHLDYVRDVAVSPDGSRIASASADGTAIIWDAETGEHLLTLGGHTGWVDAVAFSPDGQQLATGSRDKTVKMWNIAGHTDAVYSIAFSPDGATLATAHGDHSARLWDLPGGTPRWRNTLWGHTNKIYRLAFDPKGGRLATAAFDNTVILWDLPWGTWSARLEGHKDQLRDVAFSPDGKQLATVSADGTGLLYTLDGPSVGTTPISVTHNSEQPGVQASSVAFHPHPDRPEWVTGGWDGVLQRWDFRGKNLGKIVYPDTGGSTRPKVIDIAFSHDGNEIAALTGHTVHFWPVAGFGHADVQPSAAIAVAGAGSCDSIAYSLDGKELAVACADGGVRIYDATARTLVKTITVHRKAVSQAAFSPDGSKLATASLDKTFHISPLQFDQLYAEAKQLQEATSPKKVGLARAREH